MKISIIYTGTYYVITPDILPSMTVQAYKIENAINLFNQGVEGLINDIEQLEQISIINIRNLVIKYDLSNDGVDFELDADAWDGYKKYLGGIEGRKAISAKRKDELFAKGNITVQERTSFYQQMMEDDVFMEDKLSGSILAPDLENANPDSVFYNRKVVFTGVLDSISRVLAAETVKAMGADINNSISGATDFVIVGSNAGPSKLQKIADYNAKGANIRIVYEPEFLEMIKFT